MFIRMNQYLVVSVTSYSTAGLCSHLVATASSSFVAACPDFRSPPFRLPQLYSNPNECLSAQRTSIRSVPRLIPLLAFGLIWLPLPAHRSSPHVLTSAYRPSGFYSCTVTPMSSGTYHIYWAATGTSYGVYLLLINFKLHSRH